MSSETRLERPSPAVVTTPSSARPRDASIDNLKVALIAGVIVGHAIMGYADIGDWAYDSVAEVHLGHVAESVFGLLLLAPALFAMALLFLIAGMFTPGSLERKGPRRFLVDRAIRLGVPVAVFTLVLWPLIIWSFRRAAGAPLSVADVTLRGSPVLNAGPLWFLTVLLFFSALTAVWWSRRDRSRPKGSDAPMRRLRPRHLLALAFAVAGFAFAVRLVFPLATDQIGQLHLWQWPQCAGLFALGVAGGINGWLTPVPRDLRRFAGWMAVAGLLLAGYVAVSTVVLDLPDEVVAGGWHWRALVFDVGEGLVAVGGSIWVLAFAQRRWTSAGRLLREMGRSAYAAYVVQGIPLLGSALALRAADLPAEIKAVVVAVGGVAGAFALGWVLVRKTPVGRIL